MDVRQTARYQSVLHAVTQVIYREVAALRTGARLVTRSCLCIPDPSDQSMAPAPSCSHWLHSHGLVLIPLLGPGQEKQKPRELSVIQSETQDPLPRTILVARPGQAPQGILMAELSGHQASGGFLRRNRPLMDPDQRQGRKQREEERRREMRERRQKTKRCKRSHTRKGSREAQEL